MTRYSNESNKNSWKHIYGKVFFVLNKVSLSRFICLVPLRLYPNFYSVQCSVGKTCLLNRYSTGTFSGQYKATIGADFITKDVIVRDAHTGYDTLVTLQIWDTAGQERFQSLGTGFYRGADAALLTYDITDPISLDHLQHWKQEFLENVGITTNMTGVSFPFLVVGNKYDKDKKGRKIPFHRAEEWCRINIGSSAYNPQQQQPYYNVTAPQQPNLYNHYETSAKTGWNVEEVFQSVAQCALQYEEYRRRIQPQLFIPPPPTNHSIDFRHQNSSMSSSSQSDKCC